MGKLALPAILVVLSIGLSASMVRTYEPGMVGDDAYYYLGAVSLARSGQYLDLTRPGGVPQRHFVPGYPLLLAPALAWISETPTTARWISALLTAVAFALLGLLALELLPPRWALLACGWMLVQPLTGFVSTAILSEIPYLCLSLGLLLSMLRAARGNEPPAALALAAWMAGLFALFWIRPAGVSLAVAASLWLGLRGHRRGALLLGLTAAASLGGYALWTQVGAGTDPYSSELSAYLAQLTTPRQWFDALASKLALYGLEGTGFLVPWDALTGWGRIATGLGVLLALAPLAALARGIELAWGTRSLLLVLYLVAHLALLLVWPTASVRYLWPLAPVLFLLVATGLDAFARAQPGRQSLIWIWAVLTLGAGLVGQWQLASGSKPLVAGSMPAATLEWIAENVAPRTVVAAELPARLTLRTGHPSAPLRNHDRPDTLMQDLLDQGAEHVLLRREQEVQLNVGGSAQARAHAERARTLDLLAESPLWNTLHADESEHTTVLRLAAPAGRFLEAFAIFERGQSLLAAGHAEKAATLLAQALELDARLCFARLSLAALETDAGRPARALALLRGARDDWPSEPLTRFQYGSALLAQGRQVEARVELEAAIRMARAYPGIANDVLIADRAQQLLSPSPSGL